MTIDERFARIERVTAGLAEEHRNDREELRGLWRDTHNGNWTSSPAASTPSPLTSTPS
jgi:hypothetical protein